MITLLSGRCIFGAGGARDGGGAGGGEGPHRWGFGAPPRGGRRRYFWPVYLYVGRSRRSVGDLYAPSKSHTADGRSRRLCAVRGEGRGASYPTTTRRGGGGVAPGPRPTPPASNAGAQAARGYSGTGGGESDGSQIGAVILTNWPTGGDCQIEPAMPDRIGDARRTGGHG